MSTESSSTKVPQLSTVGLVVGYGLSSSLLAIINKWAITVFPYPGLLTALQYLTSTVFVSLLGCFELLELEPLTLSGLRRFFPAALVFCLAIFTNTQLLLHANVETFIIFRSSTPLLVAVSDSLIMGRSWPSVKAFLSMFVILGGATSYVLTDSQFTVRAYSWAVLYLITITTEMVYIKHVVSSVKLSTWGLVLYNNFSSLVLSPLFIMGNGEFMHLLGSSKQILELSIVGPVLLSCLFGLAISFFGFGCRKAVSATAFTVVGVTNKLLTVLINVAMWDKHASTAGIISLLVCVSGGVLYQQAVSKKPTTQESKDNNSKLPK